MSRREGARVPGTVVLDCAGLSKLCAADRKVSEIVQQARHRRYRIAISALTPIEAFDRRTNKDRFRWVKSRLRIEPVTEEISDEAVELLREAGLHGHKCAIDAVVAATARRAEPPVIVLTSDIEDLKRLCGSSIRVEAV